MDLRGISKDLQRVASKGDFRLQTQSVNMLIGEVRKYVENIKEEKEKVQEEHRLKRMLNKRPANPDEEQELQEVHDSLRSIEAIKRNISAKESALRNLEKDVHSLLTEIRKATAR